jgi:hypothetical protein
MTTLSVRDIAARHLDKTGDLSINADMYGYIHRDPSSRLFGDLESSDVLPGDGTPLAQTRRSLRRHLETISGKSVDFVLVLVGHEPDFSGVVSRSEAAKLQYALQVARDLYAQVDLGIRRVEWERIPLEDAGGHTNITTFLESHTLTQIFSGRPGALDVFIVQTMGGKAGRSTQNGPCDKGPREWMSGCVVELAGTPQFTGIVIGHEVGHYLGLGHVGDEDNLMCGPVLFERCDPSTDMTLLTTDQGDNMKDHCLINPGE